MTDQEFVDGLTASQVSHFNAYVTSIRSTFQASYAKSVAEVVTAKDALLTAREAELSTVIDTKEAELTASKEANDKLVADHTEALVKLAEDHKTTIDSKEAELVTANSTISNQSSVVSNQSETINQLQTSLIEKEALITLKNNQLETLLTKVEFLESIRTYDPNVIRSEAFYQRISKDELFSLAITAAQDDTCKGILGLLSAYKDNSWPVVLDDPQVVGAMQYLTAIALLKDGRVKEITKPAIRDEAYIKSGE